MGEESFAFFVARSSQQACLVHGYILQCMVFAVVCFETGFHYELAM